MGDRLGIPGAVSFCFSFTGQLTHFSKLQHSCVLLYPFNLIAASFCLLTSLWLLSASFVWQKTAQPLRSSFLLQGAIDRLFWQLRGRCTLLDFKFKFQEFNDKTNSQVQVFLMLVTGQKLLASEQIKYSAFSRTFLVLGNRTRDSSAQKNSMK